MAEKERFELSNGFTRYTISSRAPSTKLGDFSMPQALLVNSGYFTTGKAMRQGKNQVFFILGKIAAAQFGTPGDDRAETKAMPPQTTLFPASGGRRCGEGDASVRVMVAVRRQI